ncbi:MULTISPECIES: hypothetical protein [Fictibacillus]|uniref:hypothetical protein n=1 Tax=Fictibacillus TaxID=1329200 RepID=UPI0010132B25|nr:MULTISPECIES: hypothetical protein [Fictibacillus]RXZ02122.1 hypothetical protein DMO16_22130 [Fictibacillus sp. S7]WHY71276.1 hypothetical protein QNH15_20025 [Fictibacillus enclensis]
MAVKRLTYLDLKDAKSIRTFNNETYILKGTLAVDEENGNIEKLADIYYRVRTAIGQDEQIIAKRKNTFDELLQVNSNKRFAKKKYKP